MFITLRSANMKYTGLKQMLAFGLLGLATACKYQHCNQPNHRRRRRRHHHTSVIFANQTTKQEPTAN